MWWATMYNLAPAKAPDGTPCVVIHAQPEPVLAIDLLRNLKKAYPTLYRQVHLELVLPEGTPGIKIEGLDDG